MYKVDIKITGKIPMNIVPDYSLLTLNRYLPVGKHMFTGVSQVFPPQVGARVSFLVKIQAAVSFFCEIVDWKAAIIDKIFETNSSFHVK